MTSKKIQLRKSITQNGCVFKELKTGEGGGNIVRIYSVYGIAIPLGKRVDVPDTSRRSGGIRTLDLA